MKKTILLVLLVAAMVFSVCAFTACNFSKPGDETENQAYVSLDINPAVELIVDKDNRVVSVRGENEDGQVLLYEEAGIEGETLDVAIQKIISLAVEYGYLDENNKVVDTLVTSGNPSFADGVLNQVNTSITASAENLGLSITTDTEGAYSLLRKMEEVKAQFPNNTAIQNMSVSKFKLALSVSETGEITLEAAIALNDAELIEMLKNLDAQMEEFATEAYKAAKEKALAMYDQATALAGYAVCTQYYMEKMLSHPTTMYYGAAYQMYASAALGFNIFCDVAEYAVSVSRMPLSEAQIQAVVNALGLESADVLKNEQGEVTIESIEAYADKLFKNTPASQELETKKAALTEALSGAEIVLREKAGELAEEYRPQLEAVMESTRQLVASVDAMMSGMPESVKTVMNSVMADLRVILSEIDAILAGEKIEIADLREKAARLQAKADGYLEKIRADLSEEELAELETRRTAAIDKMTAQKAALEKALDDAEKAAKDYLAGKKEARKANAA